MSTLFSYPEGSVLAQAVVVDPTPVGIDALADKDDPTARSWLAAHYGEDLDALSFVLVRIPVAALKEYASSPEDFLLYGEDEDEQEQGLASGPDQYERVLDLSDEFEKNPENVTPMIVGAPEEILAENERGVFLVIDGHHRMAGAYHARCEYVLAHMVITSWLKL